MRTDTRTDTHEMIVVHRVFRREFRLAPRLVRAARPGDTARAAIVAAHLLDLHVGLRIHHTDEGEALWPLLLARVDLEADRVLLMEEQHRRLDALLGRALELLPAWQRIAGAAVRDELAGAYDDLLPVLLEHLTDEENNVLPLVAEYITQEEWDRLGERFEAAMPKIKVLLFLGAMLEDATPAERTRMMGELPVRARLLWWLVGHHAYAKRVRVLRKDLP